MWQALLSFNLVTPEEMYTCTHIYIHMKPCTHTPMSSYLHISYILEGEILELPVSYHSKER